MTWRRTVAQYHGEEAYTPSQAMRLKLAHWIYEVLPFPWNGPKRWLIRFASWLDPEYLS